MFKKLQFIVTLVVMTAAAAPDRCNSAQSPSPADAPEVGPVVCTVMEAFDDPSLGARAIIFHQRDKADGPRLGTLLTANSGAEMEITTSGGQRYRTTVFRVKSAFGRGLALLPIGKLSLGTHDQFTLRLVENR